MTEDTILIALGTIVLVHFFFKKYIDATKDVNELYLNEQSSIETTRLNEQSAIYKSNKLEYGGGLRVGLDIRYDHYKLRNGNFCDIWEIVIRQLKKDPNKTITLYDTDIKVSQLNYEIDEYVKYLSQQNLKSVGIKLGDRFKDVHTLTVILACLINGTLINFYEDNLNDLEYDIESDQLLLDLHRNELTTFNNEYSFEKDKGIRVRVSEKVTNKVISHTDYVTINFVSSIASTIKHLPTTESLGANDRFLLVDNQPISGLLSKLMVGLISNCKVIITKPKPLQELLDLKPTVLLVNSEAISSTDITNLKQSLNIFSKALFWQSKYFLSRGKFSELGNSNLRLLYLSKPVKKPVKLTSFQLNELRSLLSCRIITEHGYKGIIGPLLLSDFYDYRILASSVESGLLSTGCICQSDEFKLINLDNNNFGNIMVRGYNIGKVNNYLVGQGFTEIKANKDNEGFLTLEGVKGKWGVDGCLYVYSQ